MSSSDTDFRYVEMPQNDKVQIDQIVRDYTNDPTAKGLAHGVQKDAIQNGFGARRKKDEAKACKEWAFHFELKDIEGKPALIFWDEGTYGLTGKILTGEEIQALSASGGMGADHPDERLSRFLTRFESGGNMGPGAYGRGKLIFQGASKDYSILVDSLRADDNKYIAFGRKVINTRIRQTTPTPEGAAANSFLKEATEGALKPLSSPGTRITILNVQQEIIDAFVRSFEKDAQETGYMDTFSKMVEETWWEILNFGARITLRWKSRELSIKLTNPLLALVTGKDKENGVRIYEQKFMTITAGDETFKIKCLRFAVFPNQLDENLREIWIQRKRMKIGSISRHIRPHPQIEKRLMGFLVLDENLENRILEWENLTHYGFSGLNTAVIRAVREAIRSELNKFQEKLGFRSVERSGEAQQDMLDALKELNQTAKELGLITDLSTGTKTRLVDIAIKSIQLPNAETTRIDIGQELKDLRLELKSNSLADLNLKVAVQGEQGDRPPLSIFQMDLNLKASTTWEHTIPSILITNPPFIAGEPMTLKIAVFKASGDPLDRTSRTFWIGIEPPQRPPEPVNVTVFEPEFPHTKSRRVEPGESIKKIKFRLSNRTASALTLNIHMHARKAKTRTEDVLKLSELIDKKEFVLPPLGEEDFELTEFNIDPKLFAPVLRQPATPEHRKCEIFFGVTSAKNYPELGIIQAQRLARKTIQFFLSVDPPGSSIFKEVKLWEALPVEPKRSKVDGDKISGYIFYLNIKHPSYLMVEPDQELKSGYIREQMLIQAYIIAIREGIYSGPAEKFKAEFSSEDLPAADLAACFDELIGSALNKASWI